MTSLLNGVDVTKLMSRIEAVRQNPADGAFTFKVTSQWEGGLRAAHTAGDLRAGYDKKHHTASHVLHSDMPDCLAGEDSGMCAVELLLASLSACLMAGFVAHAAAMNIKLQELSIDVTGEGDVSGFFGIGSGHAGMTNISVKTCMRSTAATERLQDLHRFVTTHSPIWDTLAHRVQVDAKLVTANDDYGAIAL